MSEPVIEPVAPELIEGELRRDNHLRSYKGLEVYVVRASEAPNVMREIGRIRELEFRKEGGGTGKPCDIDDYDTGNGGFRQLVSYDPEQRELVSMYRFLHCGAVNAGEYETRLPTAHLFHYSTEFQQRYLPRTMELGRSVVNRSAKRALIGLFAVWAGLGAIVVECPSVRYFFGKFTMFPGYDARARASLFAFLSSYFDLGSELVRPKSGFEVLPPREIGEESERYTGTDYKADFQRLTARVAELGESVPPLVISYSGLTSSMKCFGTARNDRFGDVLETGILIDVHDIVPKQHARFIEGYEAQGKSRLLVGEG
jgi:hypothetical protein